jgi:hypothetical protein
VIIKEGETLDGGLTSTSVLHDAVRPTESSAEHVTAVSPTGKDDPDSGVHVIVTGAAALETVGATVTGTEFPRGDTTTGAGHVRDGPSSAMQSMSGGQDGSTTDVSAEISFDSGP